MDDVMTGKDLHLSPHEARMERVLKVLNCILSSLAGMEKSNTSTERTTLGGRNQTEIGTMEIGASPHATTTRVLKGVRLATCVTAILSNGIILLSSFWLKRPIKPALYFPLSLALANMVMMAIFTLHFGWKMGTCFELVTKILLHAWTFVPILNIIGIEITIWSAAAFPDKHQLIMTGRTTGVLVSTTWIGSVTLILFYFGLCTTAGEEIIRGECYSYIVREDGKWKIIAAVVLLLSLATVGVMEYKTWQVCHKSGQHLPRNVRDGDSFGKGMRYVRNTSLGILFTYVVGWTVFFLDYLLSLEITVSGQTEMIVEYMAALSVAIMTNISPIVYAMRFKVIKTALRAIIRKGHRRHHSSPPEA